MPHAKTKGRPSEIDIEIGKKVQAMRKLKGISQSDLAEKLDITFQQVQKYETGKNRISAGNLMQICDIFEVPPNYFSESFSGNDNEVFQSLDSKEIMEIVRECESLTQEQLKGLIRFLKDMNR